MAGKILRTVILSGLVLLLAGSNNNYESRLDELKRKIYESTEKIIAHSKEHWEKREQMNINGEVAASEYSHQDKGYRIGVLVNKNGRTDAITYSDRDFMILDLPQGGWGINTELDCFISVKNNSFIGKKSKENDFIRANENYRIILEKILKDFEIK